MNNGMTETQSKIIGEVYKAFYKLGADMELMCIIGSLGETMDDDEILEMFEQHNENGTCMAEVILDVNDTPQDRRSRMKLIKGEK